MSLRATITSPSKSPGTGCHLCHPQEALWRHPRATLRASSVQSSSEVWTALPTRVFGVWPHLPVGKAGTAQHHCRSLGEGGKGAGLWQELGQ